MVKDHDNLRHIQKGFTFAKRRPVGIHHHKNRLRIDDGFRLLMSDKHIFIKIPAVAEHVDPGTDGTVDISQYDMGLLVQHLRCPVNADCRTKAVDIRDLVAHNHYFFAVFDKFPESLRLHTGLHTGIFLHLL